MASKRLRHVLKVFSSVGLLSYREKHLPQDQQTTPVKLRQAFEQLGPSFVKIGQILSTRSDLLPEAYIRELSKLQSSVPPLSKEEVMTAIRRELPSGLSDSFLDFSEEPLASGSVAQTHRARLLSGQEVIVKIQRPGIDEVVKEDIQLLIKLARHIPKHFIPMVDVQEVLENLRETLIKELDFRNEAEAMKRFKANNRA
ncbi:MAG: ABC1 kinase family protein, partial [Streptococcus sp.]